MKKLNVTRKHFNESKYFTRKYGKLAFVSESGKLFKTDKGKVLMFKEDHAKGEHLYSIVIKDLEGWEASFQVNAMNDEEAEEKARTHMKDGEEILHIYDIGEYKAFDAEPYAGFDESGSGKSEWFDERGELVKPLPGQCIEDCSGSGRVDDEVAYWVNALKFDLGLPRERAINFLSEYGAWELDELDGMDDFNLAEKVLWIFCGNIKEDAYEQSRDETSLVYDWGEVSNWDDEDWEKFQEEYSYCSLNS